MALTTVAAVVAGNKITAAWGNTVATAITELQAATTTIRNRRHRNGLSLAGAGTTVMFGASASGTSQENVGGITFTTDATNGYFTVPEAATYAITVVLDPAAAIGATSAINIVIASTTHQVPVVGGTVRSVASLVRYLAASTQVAISVTNAGAGTTADLFEVEITRVTATTP